MPERIKAATLTDALPRTTTPAEATTMRPARCAAVKAPSSALAWCDRIAPSILSQVAAAEGVFVRFPASRYMYPLGYLLPASRPPSFSTLLLASRMGSIATHRPPCIPTCGCTSED
ncbi:hypothetical_protein [Leishmania infantum]|uniref:Uncharacterized protein n=2 Tax=Leishmania donovani species complex TaxID=38574 RepID=A0A3Q8IFA0_LEIDO|nr:hypothetical protein LdCL_310017700 [Leishmania donovani]CAC9518625.1 hypothetical_protein [Leishmania infantum]SUZ44322.1 hypothetical_protein [Leishmania infantum]